MDEKVEFTTAERLRPKTHWREWRRPDETAPADLNCKVTLPGIIHPQLQDAIMVPCNQH